MNRKQIVIAFAIVALLLAVGAVALAQTSPNYNLEWHVVGGGGEPVSSAHYAVNSTAGQGAASPPLSVSASYAVSGGYWFSSSRLPYYQIYVPIVLKQY
jgi:hypothetical protein